MRLRARLMALLLSLILLAVSAPVSASGPPPGDLTAAAERLVAFDLVRGTGTDLDLQGNIDRASLMTVMVRAWQREPEALRRQTEVHFSDTAGSWAKGYIAVAKDMAEANGFTIGTPEGFNPTGNVTGPEVVAFLLKFLGIPRKAELGWPADYLEAALEAGILSAEEKDDLLEFRHLPARRAVAFYLADKAFATHKLKDGLTIYDRLQAVRKQAPRLEIFGAPAELLVGDWTHITVKAFDSDGRVIEGVAITVRVEGAIVSYDAAQRTITAGGEAGYGTVYAEAEGYEGDSVGISVVEGELHAIQVISPVNLLFPGQTYRFRVRGLDANGNPVTLSGPVTWEVSQGTIEPDGTYRVHLDAWGSVVVTARADGLEGTVVVHIAK